MRHPSHPGALPSGGTWTRRMSGLALAAIIAVTSAFVAVAPAHAADVTAELAIAKSVTAPDLSPYAPGQTFGYTISLTCNSNLSATCANATLTDTLPAPLVFDGASPVSVAGASANTISVTGTNAYTVVYTEPSDDGPGLAAGDNETITVAVRVPTDASADYNGVPVVNTARVTADNADPQESSAPVTITVPEILDSTVTKSVDTHESAGVPVPAVVGLPVDYTIGGGNASNRSVDAVVIQDPADGATTPFDSYLDLAAITSITPPSGADRVQIEYRDAAGVWQPYYGPDVIPPDLRRLPDISVAHGLRFTFTKAGGLVPPTPPNERASIVLASTTNERVLDIPIDTEVTLPNSASSVVRSGTTTTSPRNASATVVISNVAPGVAVAKGFNAEFLLAGKSTKATISATNGARRVSRMVISEPSSGQPDLGAQGLDFGGFTTGVIWPDGATSASVLYRYADGTSETLPTSTIDTLPAPTRAGVVGFDVVFLGSIEANTAADLPFTVTAQPVPGSTDVTSTNATTATVTDERGLTGTATDSADLTRQPARVSTTLTKNISRAQIFAVPGTTNTVALQAAVNEYGPNASTVGSQYLRASDPADPSSTPSEFWNAFDVAQISAGVPNNADLTIQYWTGTTWTAFAGAASIIGPTRFDYTPTAAERAAAQGIRFLYVPKAGQLLPPGFNVVPNFTVSSRATFRTGGSIADAARDAPAPGLPVTNNARSDVANPLDTDPSDNTAVDSDQVILKPVSNPGPDLLDKHWLGVDAPLYSFSDQQRTARVGWSTEGIPFSSVAISDPASSGELTDVSTSVYDAFDLARIQAISTATDPTMTYDRVSKVELYDGVVGDWVDITTSACPTAAACDGTFPGYSLTADERASTLGVRVTYAEGSNRGTPPAPAKGSGVAPSFGHSRNLDLSFQLRQVKRSGGPVTGGLHPDGYNTGEPGVVRNSVNLTGTGAQPFSQDASDDIAIADSTVNVSTTKVFDQDSTALPPPGTDPALYPIVTATLTARNESESKVGSLTITDPSPAQGLPTFYATFNLAAISAITLPAGATDAIVTLARGQFLVDYSPTEAQALTAADLDDVTGLQITFENPDISAIQTGATASVQLSYQARATIRGPRSVPVSTTATSVNTSRGIVLRPGGDPRLDTAFSDATASVSFVEATYGVDAIKTLTPGSRYEDEPRTGYTLTLSGQPTGNVRTNLLTLTDDRPTFWNAFTLAGLPPVTLPAPARQLRVSALTGVEYSVQGGVLVATCDGQTDLTGCWQAGSWQDAAADGRVDPVLPTGVSASDVRGLRFEVRKDAASSNWERPRNPTVKISVGATRNQFLHYGPGDEIDSYPVPSTLPGLQTAPGETVQGTTTDSLGVHGDGSWINPTSGALWSADDSATATTRLLHRVNAISVVKAPGNGNGGGSAQQFPPTATIPYVITITNTGAWKMTGLALTDQIGTNANGSLLLAPVSGTNPFTFVRTSATGATLPVTGFSAVLDPATGTVAITVPAGFVFGPGEKLVISAGLVFQAGLAPNTPVGNTVGATSDRAFETCAYSTNSATSVTTSRNVTQCAASTTVVPAPAAPIQVVKAVKGVGAGVPGAAPGDANYDDLGVLNTTATNPSAANCATPNAGRGYYTNACVPITRPGGTESWRITFSNRGNIASERVAAIDVLPAPGDTGVTLSTPRGSNWAATLLGNARSSASGATLTGYYLTSVPSVSCNAADIQLSTGAPLAAGNTCAAEVAARAWTVFTDATPAAQLAAAKAVKFVLSYPAGGGLAPGASVDISFDTKTAAYSPSAPAGGMPIAWNAVAAGSRGTFNNAPVYQGPVEPVRTGVALPSAQLQLSKKVVKPAGWTYPLPTAYTFTLTCTSGGVTVPIVNTAGAAAASISVPADGTPVQVGASLNIPLYADCKASEASSPGATVTYSPVGTTGASGTVQALRTFQGRTDVFNPFQSGPITYGAIQATNTYEFAGFTVSKSVITGGAVDQTGTPIRYDPFTFSATCTFNGATVLSVPSFSLQDPPSAGNVSSRTFDALPAGAVCTVAETTVAGSTTTITVTTRGIPSAPTTSRTTTFTLVPDAADGTHQITSAFTNRFTVGSVRVTKQATGTLAGTFGDFTLRMVCTLAAAAPDTVFDATRTMTKGAPNNVWQVDNLPTRASCTVTETDAGGATQTTFFPASANPPRSVVTVPVSPAAAAVAVTNDFRTGSLQVSKTVAGSGLPLKPTGPFTFSYVCTYAGATFASGTLTITGDGTAGPFSKSVDGLPVRTVCVVTETDAGGADPTVPLATTATVTIPDHTAGSPDQVVTAAFTNRFSAGTLSISKKLTGAAAAESWATGAAYTVHVMCQLDDAGTRRTIFDGDVKVTGAATVQVRDPQGAAVLLPRGTHCWGDETGTGGATSSSVDFTSYDNAAVVTAQPGNTPQAITITATNRFEYGSLVVSKKLGGDTVHGVGRTFELLLTCTFDQGAGNGTATIIDDRALRLQGGQSSTIDELPIGATCSVVESDQQGAYAVSIDPSDPVTITASPTTASITVTNYYYNAGFTVSKTVDTSGAVDQNGKPIVYDVAFAFTASCLFQGDEQVPVADQAFSLRDGQTKEFSGLPAGATCEVVETDAAGAASTTVAVGSPGKPGAPVDGTRASFDLEPDVEGAHATAVAVTNRYTVGSVSVTKKLTGAGADAWGGGTFAVRLLCTLPDAATNPVFDATRELTRTSPDWPVWTVTDLPTGATCTVTEPDNAGATDPGVVDPAGGFTVGNDAAAPTEVTVTNDFRVGGLNVVKTLAGPGAPDFSDGPFTFDVQCTYEGATVYTGSLSVEGDGTGGPLTSATITGIPVKSVCIVTETNDGGADSTPAPVTITIRDEDNGVPSVDSALFTNVFSLGTVAITKVLDGSAQEADYVTSAVFTVQVTCQLELRDGSRATLFGGPVEVTGGQTVVVTNDDGDPVHLPLGTHCFGEESDAAGASASSLDFDSFDNAAIVTVANAPQQLDITATNTFDDGSIELSKVVTGDVEQANGKQFRIAITCTLDRGANDPFVALDARVVTLTAGQTQRFDDLPLGAKCWANEVDKGGAASVKISATQADPLAVVGGSVARITVTNQFDPPLASTGVDADALRVGLSSAAMLVLGGLAVLLAAYRRRRRRS